MRRGEGRVFDLEETRGGIEIDGEGIPCFQVLVSCTDFCLVKSRCVSVLVFPLPRPSTI
jgi:hypothetical protein